ncbi:hypothetical protein [Streptomyces indiaensis]|uniref:Helix-turn-helix protein n=1 Tax=Streptomyces indiaensis TaxID=284033 RepID=A0ABN3DHK2_9ACTN
MTIPPLPTTPRTHRSPWRPPRSALAGEAAARSRCPRTSAPASHEALLERLRHQISAQGVTLDELARRTGFSKGRISVLLRGIEYYPSWEITYSVVHALALPPWPLCRLWTAGAYEAAKSTTWITQRIAAVRPLGPEERPVEHRGFIEQMEHYYASYAQALLHIERPEWIVAEAFDILWAGWDETEAATGPNLPRYAWRLLRSRVLLRVRRHPDGRPDLRPAAFMTVSQSRIEEPVARFVEISEVADFSTRSATCRPTSSTSLPCATCASSPPTRSRRPPACPRLTSTPSTTTHEEPSNCSTTVPQPGSDHLDMSAFEDLLARAALLKDPASPLTPFPASAPIRTRRPRPTDPRSSPAILSQTPPPQSTCAPFVKSCLRDRRA